VGWDGNLVGAWDGNRGGKLVPTEPCRPDVRHPLIGLPIRPYVGVSDLARRVGVFLRVGGGRV
jgi:hypothetical protein